MTLRTGIWGGTSLGQWERTVILGLVLVGWFNFPAASQPPVAVPVEPSEPGAMGEEAAVGLEAEQPVLPTAQSTSAADLEPIAVEKPRTLPASPRPPDLLAPRLRADSFRLDVRNELDSNDRLNQFTEATALFRLQNNSQVRVTTGFNLFDEPDTESVINVPLQVGWQGQVNRVSLQAGAGVDFFDRLPTAVNLNARAEATVLPGVTVSGMVEQGPYKFNARTLENQITAWRFGPSLYWQINPQTSLYTQYRYGLYNDGNDEHQSFSRLERKIGQFFVAGNLFTWSYDEDLEDENGYFSPPDFLVYTGEAGWEGKVVDPLSCRLAANAGQQRLRGDFELTFGYQARCTARITSDIEADLGYAFSNARQSEDEDDYNNRTFSAQLRVKF